MPVEPPVTSPRDLGEAYAQLAAAPARPIAGGTDLMVELTGELGEPPDRIVDLWRLDELRGIAIDGDAISLGALTTYTEIRRSALCREHLPVLVDAAATIGAAQIQNRGTIGGNVVNASPAGDTLPVFLAADATFVLGSARGERTVPAAEFWPAYRKTVLAPDELLLRIRVPLFAGREMRFRKVGTRRAQSISKVVMALGWRDGSAGAPLDPVSSWTDVRLALGSVAATPIRATATEAVLEGRPPTPETADRAAEALGRRAPPDRRRPFDGRVPPPRLGPRPASPHPRGGRLVMAAEPAGSLDIDELDVIAPGAFAAAVAPLFEGARGFLGRLALARPFDSVDAMFDRAREIAHAMPLDEQIELIDAHPRLGASPAAVSDLSRVEQASGADDAAVAVALERLNAAYEASFGFRYCVFVAGRPRAALLPGFEAALHADRDAEIERALDAVIDIARARYATLTA